MIRKITFVKKILANGEPCAKCGEIEARMVAEGQMARIDETLIADERDPASAGMLLAADVNAERAPFFVVDYADGRRVVYTIYFKFVREVLEAEASEKDELQEILRNSADLDFI